MLKHQYWNYVWSIFIKVSNIKCYVLILQAEHTMEVLAEESEGGDDVEMDVLFGPGTINSPYFTNQRELDDPIRSDFIKSWDFSIQVERMKFLGEEMRINRKQETPWGIRRIIQKYILLERCKWLVYCSWYSS